MFGAFCLKAGNFCPAGGVLEKSANQALPDAAHGAGDHTGKRKR